MAGSKYKIEFGIAGIEKTVAGINKVRNASQARAAAAEARRRLAQIDLEERKAAEEALPPKQRLAKLEQERARNKQRLAEAEKKLQDRERRGLKSPALDHRVQALRLANREIDRHIAKIQRANKEARKASGFGGFVKGQLRGALAVGAGYFGARAARQTLSDAGELKRRAGTIGISTDLLQEYQFAGSANSIDDRTTGLAVQRFGRRLQEAQAGKGELKGTLTELGIDPTGKSIEEAMREFADAIAKLPEDQRLRHAFKAFDSEGAAFVNVLANGADGLAKYAEQAHQVGAVLDKEVVDRLAQADAQLVLFGRQAKIMFANLIAAILPTLQTAVDGFHAFVDRVLKGIVFIKTAADELLAGNFSGAVKLARQVAEEFAADQAAKRAAEKGFAAKLKDAAQPTAAAEPATAAQPEAKAVAIKNDFKRNVDELQRIGGFRGSQSDSIHGTNRRVDKVVSELEKLRVSVEMGNRRLEQATRETLG